MAGKRNLFNEQSGPVPRRPQSNDFEEPRQLNESVYSKNEHECYSEIVGSGNVAFRLHLESRNGRRWSYPYSYLSLIDLPSPECLVLHANCGHVEVIEIKGRGLDRLMQSLDHQRLSHLREAEHPDYSGEAVVVSSIILKRIHNNR